MGTGGCRNIQPLQNEDVEFYQKHWHTILLSTKAKNTTTTHYFYPSHTAKCCLFKDSYNFQHIFTNYPPETKKTILYPLIAI